METIFMNPGRVDEVVGVAELEAILACGFTSSAQDLALQSLLFPIDQLILPTSSTLLQPYSNDLSSSLRVEVPSQMPAYRREMDILKELEMQWNELQRVGCDSTAEIDALTVRPPMSLSVHAPSSHLISPKSQDGIDDSWIAQLLGASNHIGEDIDIQCPPLTRPGSPSSSESHSTSPLSFNDFFQLPPFKPSIHISGPYKCPIPFCTKSFSRSYNLKSHLVSHSTNRTFSCGVCARTFLRKHDMLRHEKLHEGKKACCAGCGKQFARHDGLKRHLRSSTRDTSCPRVRALRAAGLDGFRHFKSSV